MRHFEHNILAIYKNIGKQWLAALPNLIATQTAEWNLTALKPLPNLSHHYVMTGLCGTRAIVLKLGLDADALATEAHALRMFAGHGAIKVLAESKGALLLERAQPGITLENYVALTSDKVLEICCDVMQQLQQVPITAEMDFPHMRTWLATLNEPWAIPAQLLNKARQLSAQLLTLNQPTVLLHGDLHRGNILLTGNRWKAIGPKGVLGAPINEVWAFVNNIEHDATYLARRLKVEILYVLQWYFVHVVMAACWRVEDNLSPDLFINLAAQTYRLL